MMASREKGKLSKFIKLKGHLSSISIFGVDIADQLSCAFGLNILCKPATPSSRNQTIRNNEDKVSHIYVLDLMSDIVNFIMGILIADGKLNIILSGGFQRDLA